MQNTIKTIINVVITIFVIWLLLALFFGVIWPILVILMGCALLVALFYWLYRVVINAFNLESASSNTSSQDNSKQILPEKEGWDFSEVEEANIVD